MPIATVLRLAGLVKNGAAAKDVLSRGLYTLIPTGWGWIWLQLGKLVLSRRAKKIARVSVKIIQKYLQSQEMIL